MTAPIAVLFDMDVTVVDTGGAGARSWAVGIRPTA